MDGCGRSFPPIGIGSHDRPARGSSFAVPTELSCCTYHISLHKILDVNSRFSVCPFLVKIRPKTPSPAPTFVFCVVPSPAVDRANCIASAVRGRCPVAARDPQHSAACACILLASGARLPRQFFHLCLFTVPLLQKLGPSSC